VKFGFYSCMTGMPWGGSEELWWRTARKLQVDGAEVCVNYKWWPETARQLVQLQDAGGNVWFRNKPAGYWQQKFGRARFLVGRRNGPAREWLEQTRPDAVLVTLGFHPDRIDVASDCIAMGIPYAINVQCASNTFFIHSDCLDEYRNWYRHAEKVFFVSDENRQKMEVNLAMELPNQEIVANPFNLRPGEVPPWPETGTELSLACVGRLHFQSKGQDVVVQVFRQPKWRARDIRVNFYGSDQGNRRQLEEMISMYGLEKQLAFHGFCQRVTDIWSENHALLLPSRYEGAPLVLVEAMLSNRITIATDTGRNRELLDDGRTGFIADSATVAQLDDALERAWAVRQQWRELGEAAGRDIRRRYTLDPIGDFADKLRTLVPGARRSAAALNGHAPVDRGYAATAQPVTMGTATPGATAGVATGSPVSRDGRRSG
jgi:glycosyltransferase involved in cell wall biosynthesis